MLATHCVVICSGVDGYARHARQAGPDDNTEAVALELASALGFEADEAFRYGVTMDTDPGSARLPCRRAPITWLGSLAL